MELSKEQNMNMGKRAERITSAIFLVSNIMSDSEILKTKIRQLGLDLVSNSLFLQDTDPLQSYGKLFNLRQTTVELISLLSITSISGAVSQMNASILKTELESMLKEIDLLQNDWGVTSNVPKNFFKDNNTNDVPTLQTIGPKASNIQERSGRKDQRTKAILGVIDKRGEVGIKDISLSVKGCSEKTVQRELNTLIASGVVKKTGERRWSRYSLA